VLLNITGGPDLGIDEVTEISTIINEEAGDSAEIIFGAVEDPQLVGKVRVTVIATGFDADDEMGAVITPDFRRAPVSSAPRSRPTPPPAESASRESVRPAPAAPAAPMGSRPAPRPQRAPVQAQFDLGEPRQMAVGGGSMGYGGSGQASRAPQAGSRPAMGSPMRTPAPSGSDMRELDIPTFIRRQMD
jgi:cell division protein FtsZ